MDENVTVRQAAPISNDRALAAWEIMSVLSSIVLAEWVALSIGGGQRLLLLIPVGIAFVFMFLSHRLRRESARDVGWRMDNFGKAARLLILPTLVPCAFLLCVGWLTSSVNFARWGGAEFFWGAPLAGIGWGLLQQYALQGFVNRRAEIVWGRGWSSVTVVALFFAALHLPNPLLTLATFIGGLMWASVYQRAPNLLVLGLSHGLMTWALISTVPPAWLYNLRVGFKFFG